MKGRAITKDEYGTELYVLLGNSGRGFQTELKSIMSISIIAYMSILGTLSGRIAATKS